MGDEGATRRLGTVLASILYIRTPSSARLFVHTLKGKRFQQSFQGLRLGNCSPDHAHIFEAITGWTIEEIIFSSSVVEAGESTSLTVGRVDLARWGGIIGIVLVESCTLVVHGFICLRSLMLALHGGERFGGLVGYVRRLP